MLSNSGAGGLEIVQTGNPVMGHHGPSWAVMGYV